MTKEEFIKAMMIQAYAARIASNPNDSAKNIARLAREDVFAAYNAIQQDCNF